MKSWRLCRSSFLFIFSLWVAGSLLFLLSVPIKAHAQNIQDSPVPDVKTDSVLTIWSNETVAPVLEAMATDFENDYDVELVVEVVPNTSGFFPAALEGGGPDITFLPHDQLGLLVEKGLLAPIDISNLDTLIIQSALDAGTYAGELYGLPWASENLGFFYNNELVTSPPTSWNSVVSIGNDLIASGDVQYGMSLAGSTYDAYPLMTAFGGYVFGQDAGGAWDINDLGIDSPGMIAAVHWLADRVNEGFLSSDTDWETAHVLFETGQTPFIMAGPWALDRIRSSGVPYTIADFPSQEALPGYPFLGVQVFVINANSLNIPLARTFLQDYVLTKDTMDDLYVATKRLPVFLDSIPTVTDPDSLKFIDIALNAEPMPNVPQMGNVWTPWDMAVDNVLQGTQNAEEALVAAASEIRASYNLEGMVNVPGSYQILLGCSYDWSPSCAATSMTQVRDTWTSGPFKLPAGDYECKVALDGGWAINYGMDGVFYGDNIPFSIPANKQVKFSWDEETKLLTIETISYIFLPSVGK